MNPLSERYTSIWEKKTLKQLEKEVNSLREYMKKHDSHYAFHGKALSPEELSDGGRLLILLDIMQEKSK